MTPIPCWRSSGKRSIPILLLASLAVAVPVPAVAASAAESCSYTKADDVPTAMRDGTILRSNVFTPTAPGTFPVILLRLPYNKDLAQTYVYASPGFYASHCYIVVVQDVRGQYKSDGFFYTFRYEANDGYDTIEWAAKQPWSNGKIGTFGLSYPGAVQWLAAVEDPPHLRAMVPAMTFSTPQNFFYAGGVWDKI